MTEEIKAGKNLVISIIAVILGISLLTAIPRFVSMGFSVATLVPFALNVLLAIALYRGNHWARWIIGILALMAGILAMSSSIALISSRLESEGELLVGGVIWLLVGIAYVVSALFLFRSKNIVVFLNHQKDAIVRITS